MLVINYTQTPLHLQQQPWLIGGLKTGVFLIYDALVTARGVLVALLVIVGIGAILIAGLALFRFYRGRKSNHNQGAELAR